MKGFRLFDETRLSGLKKPVRVMGIDLGTTNSTAAFAEFNPDADEPVKVECVEIEQPSPDGKMLRNVLVPSFVAVHEGKTLVGEGARMMRSMSGSLKLRQNENIFYECKNEMGIRKTYHTAPNGFRNASEIGGRILEFISGAAQKTYGTAPEKIVVTVPASFQVAQRHDTLKAASVAGMNLTGGYLLDEPVAAFIDYLACEGMQVEARGKNSNWLIFDFGGGTCDVAIASVKMNGGRGWPEISTTSVSRYHRLGGGDIDASIFYEVLLPQIMKSNSMSELYLGYEEKKKILEPAFIGVAERLKIKLCDMMRRSHLDYINDNSILKININKPWSRDMDRVLERIDMDYKKYPDSLKAELDEKFECNIGNLVFKLERPYLTAAAFNNVLKPFLNHYVVQHSEDEYRTTCSIFGPLTDALERAGLEPDQIDNCLLVGGSTLIPQVCDEVKKFFRKAQVRQHSNLLDVQTCVARGAAYHALSLSLFGRPLIQPVCHEAISINTSKGPVKLIPKGASVPYPGQDGFSEFEGLKVPKSSEKDIVPIRIEIFAGEREKKRLIHSNVCRIPAPVSAGQAIKLKYQLDENQMLAIKMSVVKRDDILSDEHLCFNAEIENPLTHIVNPNKIRLEIEDIEEKLRTDTFISAAEVMDNMVILANKYSEVGQRERAIDYLKRVIRNKDKPDFHLLHNLALLTGQTGDIDSEIKIYEEMTVIDPKSWCPHFNKSLAYERKGAHKEAIASMEEVLKLNPKCGPSEVFIAMQMRSLNDSVGYEIHLAEAVKNFGNPEYLGDWDLGWYITAMTMRNDWDKQKIAEDIRKKRNKDKVEKVSEGYLPEFSCEIP